MELPSPSSLDVCSAIAWLAVMLGICVAVSVLLKKAGSTLSSWLLGSRNFGPVVTGLAISATWMSGWACLGLMGITYAFGWSGIWLAGVWTLIGIIPCAVVVGPKLRGMSEKLGASTVSELVGKLYDSRLVGAVASVVYTLLMLVYSVGQYKAAATAWHVVTGSPWTLSIVMSAVIMIAYMIMGGYRGTQWTLSIQAVLMVFACYLLAYMALAMVGGPLNLNEALAAQDPKLVMVLRPDLPPNNQYAADLIGLTASLGLFVTMAIGFPHNVARLLGMRRLTRRDLAIMTLTVVVASSIPWANLITGLAARALFGTAVLGTPARADAAAPYVALLAGPAVSGLYMAAVFAASLSTLAGMVLVMAGSITNDLLRTLKPNMSERRTLIVAKALTALFALIPLLWVVSQPPPLLAYLMAGAATGLGCIFIFTLATTLYWRGAHKYGAIACMVYGLAMTVLGGYYVYTLGQWGWGYWWWATFIGCAVTYVGFSVLGRRLERGRGGNAVLAPVSAGLSV
ncbi:MAG: hypothetical protein QFX33_00900 [Candidatus Nezhaarchaeota archaeon]|nr:hypothetical protein [Candidatus Nezhaarchaeota archaeon]